MNIKNLWTGRFLGRFRREAVAQLAVLVVEQNVAVDGRHRHAVVVGRKRDRSDLFVFVEYKEVEKRVKVHSERQRSGWVIAPLSPTNAVV